MSQVNLVNNSLQNPAVQLENNPIIGNNGNGTNRATRSSLTRIAGSRSTENTSNASGSHSRSLFEILGLAALPLVSAIFAIIQILIFVASRYFQIDEHKISVSWHSVVIDGELWRVLVAHFFHFTKVHLFINCVSLLAMGRYLEKKIKAPAMFALIQIMGVVSNIFYIIISNFICGDPDHASTFGLAHAVFGLRVLLAYTQEPRNYSVTLLLGLYPLYLPVRWAPWEPVLEMILFKLIMPELVIIGRIAGILTGFLVSFVILLFPHSIIYKRPIQQVSNHTVSRSRTHSGSRRD